MRSAVLCVVVALVACSPAAALAAGWTVSHTQPVHGRIVPLTDKRGGVAYNERLAERRAEAVARVDPGG